MRKVSRFLRGMRDFEFGETSLLQAVAGAGNPELGSELGGTSTSAMALQYDLGPVPASLRAASSLSTTGVDWLRYEDSPGHLCGTCLAHVSQAHKSPG